MADDALMPTTFEGLIELMRARDAALEAPMDMGRLIGDALHDKVDSLEYVHGQLEDAIAARERTIAAVRKSKSALETNYKNLRAYMARAMTGTDPTTRYERIPGNRVALKLYDSPWKVTFHRQPTASDYGRYPGLVEMDRSYRWVSDEVQRRAVAGELPPDFPASASRGTYVKFEEQKSPVLSRKKGKRNARTIETTASSEPAAPAADEVREPDDDLKGVF